MPGKTGIVTGTAILGGVMGYLWITLLATDKSWFESTRYSSDSPFVWIAASFCAVWSAVTIGTLAYALATPRVSRVVAAISAAFLCFLMIGTTGPMFLQRDPPSFINWLTTVWQLTAPASLGAISTIATVFVKQQLAKRSSILVQP